MLRGLRNWEISLIAGKIRDDFIEEIAFDLSLKEGKDLDIQKCKRWKRTLQNRNSKINISEMCLHRM